MRETVENNVCERANDLVAFLYGELSQVEARKFERHMQECDACKTEYSSFGSIHQSIVAWRDQSLGVRPGVPQTESLVVPVGKGTSAWTAFREFFSLAPFWVKGATALVGVLFCVSLTLAVFYLTQSPDPEVAAVPLENVNEQQLRNQISDLQSQLSSLQGSEQAGQEQASLLQPVTDKKPRTVVPKAEYANARRPLTRQERMELAADLRLVSANDDDEPDLGIDGGSHP